MNKNAASKKAVYTPGANYQVALPGHKPSKRKKVFSQSRDTREDRGSRQMKTSNNPQTLPHGR